ncbi:MAG: Gfo/Idh/MocA family oxidoreductase, partial [Clostridia bacterium]|nr:Gfo/Idh/MocA family oxidoreductase [Clostridia bacterium]
MPLMRYGVIGTGWITRSMIDGAKQYDFLRLTAVCSRTQERGEQFAAENGGATVFTDPAAMAAYDGIDMVYIASPNSCHAAQCRLFLQAGKHVLCEKPLCADPQEVEALQKLANKKGVLFREAIMMLYQPQLASFRQAVLDCGRISMAHFDYCQLSSKYGAYQRGECPNIFNPQLHTGALMDLGVYCVYPALYLFGEPQEVRATATFLRTGADGEGSALLVYPDKQVVLTYSKTGQSAVGSQVVGDKGTLRIDTIA